MKDFDYAQLDDGIRDIVRELHKQGFGTCDSGDGSKHPEMTCALPYKNVAIPFNPAAPLALATYRIRDVLEGFTGYGWHVEVQFAAGDVSATVLCFPRDDYEAACDVAMKELE